MSSPRRSATSSTRDAELRFDTSKPDGTPRKVLDVTRLANTGWTPSISLDDGIATTYQWFLDQTAHHHDLRGVPAAATAN